MNPRILERDPSDPQKQKKEGVNPLLKMVLELG
ncbi:MAG: septation protein A, partial [Mesorhizobium sp.]